MAEKKEKDAEKKSKASRKAKEKETSGYATGYETDGAASTSGKKKLKLRKKSKASASAGPGDGYETDDGYMSTPTSSKKSRFFRLGTNKSKTNLELSESPAEPVPPPMPAFRLPIAERFATTLNLNQNGGDPALGPPVLPSTSPSTSVPESRPEDRNSLDRGPVRAFSPKRAGLHLSSDGSEQSGSSTGHSFFQKFTSSSSSSSSPTSSKPPIISLPITRSPSPPSPHQTPAKSGSKRVPDALSLNAQQQQPGSRSASPALSPFVLLTPNDVSAPLPSENMPRPRVKFLSKSADGIFKPKTPLKPIDTFTPSSTDPGSEPPLEPPPNTFSFYELPPPSPPPISPLPQIPADAAVAADIEHASRFAAQQKFLSDTSAAPSRSVSPVSGSATPRRGRESPFPARPILPGGSSIGSSRVGAGLESRVKVRRYRDLYTLPVSTPPAGWTPSSRSANHNGRFVDDDDDSDSLPMASAPAALKSVRFGKRYSSKVGIDVEQPSGDEDEWGYGYDEDEYNNSEMQHVLNRFKGGSSLDVGHQPALERSRSFEALRNRYQDAAQSGTLGQTSHATGSDDESRYPDDETQRATIYTVDSERRWSGTPSEVPSRYSIMDQTKSEESRQRFIARIDTMFDQNGREKLPPRNYIPPVPKIPQSAIVAGKASGWF